MHLVGLFHSPCTLQKSFNGRTFCKAKLFTVVSFTFGSSHLLLVKGNKSLMVAERERKNKGVRNKMNDNVAVYSNEFERDYMGNIHMLVK